MAAMRVRLAKGEAARWLSPRDFANQVHDAAVRAGLPIRRGGGPKARLRMAPGPQLAPGYLSRSEYIDFELSQPITPSEFGRRLRAELPDGVDVVWQRRLPPCSPHIRASVRGIEYTVTGDFDAERARAFARAEAWPLTRIKKDRERILDLKRSVASLKVGEGFLRLVISVSNEGTPKPEEIIESVFGIRREEAASLPAERTGMAFAPPRDLRAGTE